MKLSLSAITGPAAAGLIVWLLVTLLFRWFGHLILVPTHDEQFFGVFVAMQVCTGIGIWLAGWMYHTIDRAPFALLRFGIIGSAVGLLLDSVSLSLHAIFFPSMNDVLLHSFFVWLVFAYGLFLLIPAMQNVLAQAKRNR